MKTLLLRPAVRTTLGVAALGLLCVVAWQQREQLASMLLAARPSWFILSIVLGILANCVTGGLLCLLLRQHGIDVSFSRAAHLQLLAQLGKYIPGKIWGSILQAQIAQSQRIGSFLLAGFELSTYLMLSLAGIGISLLALGRLPFVSVIVAASAITIPSFVFSRAWVPRLAVRLSTSLKAVQANLAILRPQRASHFAIAGSIHAIVHLASIVALLIGILGWDREVLIVGTASLLLSWVIGNLAIIFPSGIGAREIAFVAIAHWLSMPADVATITLIAILARVAQVLQDLVTAIIAAPAFFPGARARHSP